MIMEPLIIYLYWLYEVKYADEDEDDEVISDADVHLNKLGPQLGGPGLRFAASAMKQGMMQAQPVEMLEPTEPEPELPPDIEPDYVTPPTPRRVETPRRPQTPMASVPAPVPVLALEQVPEPETPEMTPAPPTPPVAAEAAMQEIQRMREELKARAERTRLQVQAQAARNATTAGGPGSPPSSRGGVAALSALRPLRPAADAVIAQDRLSGLMANRGGPTRADRLQRLALSPFARNSSALTGSRASRAGGGAGGGGQLGSLAPLAPLASRSSQRGGGSTAAAEGAAAAAEQVASPSSARGGLGRTLPPLQAVPRSSPRRFSGSPRTKGSPNKGGDGKPKPGADGA